MLDAVAAFRTLVRHTDPNRFSEDQFVAVGGSISRVTGALELYLRANDTRLDATQLLFLSDSIRELRDAKHWIVQGLPPDPAKRPPDHELNALTDERAAAAFAALSDRP